MTAHINDGGVWRQASALYVNDGVWRNVQGAYYNDGVAWRQFFSAASHTVSKSGDASGSATSTGTFNVTTNSVTVTVTGGVGPFTYAWSSVAGTAATANSPTAATTTFTRSGTAPNSYTGTMRCTVTDTGNGNMTAYVDVTVATTNNATAHSVTKSGDASGTGTGTGTFNVTTNAVTANVSNGVGPFTYSWSYVSGTAATANSATSATTTFTRTGSVGNSYSGVYRCTVTDTGNGNLTASVDVTVGTTHNSSVVNHTTSLSDSGGYCSYDTGLGQTACASASTITANVSNGVGPFTYAWSKVGGSLLIAGPTNGSTLNISSGNTAAGVYGCTFRCVVTDTGNSNYQTTTDLYVEHTHDSY